MILSSTIASNVTNTSVDMMQFISTLMAALAAASISSAIAPPGSDDAKTTCTQVAANVAGTTDNVITISSNQEQVLEAVVGDSTADACKLVGKFPAGSVLKHEPNTKFYIYDMNVKYRKRGDPLKTIFEIKPFTITDIHSIERRDLIGTTTFDLSPDKDFEVVLGESFKCKDVLRFKVNVTGDPFGEIEYRQSDYSGIFVQTGDCELEYE